VVEPPLVEFPVYRWITVTDSVCRAVLSGIAEPMPRLTKGGSLTEKRGPSVDCKAFPLWLDWHCEAGRRARLGL